jgi:AcrR family transcriptional regulator
MADAVGAESADPSRPRRGRPRDPEVDAAILTAAMELLGELGYARLTMDRVADRASVSKPSLYLRWSDKVALVADAIGHRARPIPDVPDTGSLAEDMRVFLRALLRSKNAAAKAVAAVAGEIASNPELRKAWRSGIAGALTERVSTIVTRAVERGDLPADSDVELLSVLPQALLQHWATWRADNVGRDPDDALVERIVRQFYDLGDRQRAGSSTVEERDGRH